MITNSTQSYPKKLTLAYYITLLLSINLVICFTVWQLVRDGGVSYFFWFVQCSPIAIVLPGMWLQKPRAFIWLCFIMLVYFIDGVGGMFTPATLWIDYIVLISSILIFTSAMFTARWLQQYFNHRN